MPPLTPLPPAVSGTRSAASRRCRPVSVSRSSSCWPSRWRPSAPTTPRSCARRSRAHDAPRRGRRGIAPGVLVEDLEHHRPGEGTEIAGAATTSRGCGTTSTLYAAGTSSLLRFTSRAVPRVKTMASRLACRSTARPPSQYTTAPGTSRREAGRAKLPRKTMIRSIRQDRVASTSTASPPGMGAMLTAPLSGIADSIARLGDGALPDEAGTPAVCPPGPSSAGEAGVSDSSTSRGTLPRRGRSPHAPATAFPLAATITAVHATARIVVRLLI